MTKLISNFVRIPLISISILLLGCSGTEYLGSVGDTKFYIVERSKVDGPNVSVFVTEKNGQVTVHNVMASSGIGNSIGPAIIGGASDIAVESIREPDAKITTTTTTVSSQSDSNGGQGGSAEASGGNSSSTSQNQSNSNNTRNTNKVNSDNTTNNNSQTTHVGGDK
jgi:hypothetical protein